MIDGIFYFVSLPCAAIFLASLIRACIFAHHHRDQFRTSMERSSWFLRVFMRNGFGARLESKRRLLAIVILASGAGFFGVTGLVFALFGPGQVPGN